MLVYLLKLKFQFINLLNFVYPNFKYKPNSINTPLLSEQQIISLAEKVSLLCQPVAENKKLSHLFKKGDQISPYRGSGLEYEESKPYQFGDEVRNLNWRLMARTGKPFSKQFQEERQESWVILLDMRQSMRYGTRKRLKVTQGLLVAGYYAWLAQTRGVTLEAIAVTEKMERSAIFEGRGSYSALMHFLSRPCPAMHNISEPNLADVIMDMHSQLQSGTRLILISDFHDLENYTIELLLSLQSTVRLKAIGIMDQSEVELCVDGVRLESFDGKQFQNINDLQTQESYKIWAKKYFATKQINFKKANVSIKWMFADESLDVL